MIHSVVLTSVQQSDSVDMYIYIYSFRFFFKNVFIYISWRLITL